ncbi:MAG TPA: L-lactate permease [Puia sp.]|nr:L-lactate permease [Puia sp.]
MAWTQPLDPCHNLPASCVVAIVPVAVIFWALVVRKIKGYHASMLATATALLIAVVVYRMPINLALLSAANGALYGLFPICWIVFTAVFLFNITIRSGQFEIIRGFLAGITADRRIQALLIAFSFGSFLEGTAGFGAPVAITAAMLTGLGFNPLYAAGLCLIANTAPVAFGSIGIPITVIAQVTSLPEHVISQMVGRTLPFLSALLPFYLVILMAGFKRMKEVAPAALVSGLSFALIQWATSNYLGPALPDILAGIGSIFSLLILLRFWRPRSIWRFPGEAAVAHSYRPPSARAVATSYGAPPPTTSATGQPLPATTSAAEPAGGSRLLWAFSPFIALTVMVITWGLVPVKDWLTSHGTVEFAFPAHVFKLNYLSAAGTAILLAAIISLPLSALSARQGLQVLGATCRQLAYPILSIAVVLAFAYLMNDSGITATIAHALADTGVLFPFFAPVLGWLGVFITGSDTSSNALFGKLQSATATSIGVDPVVTVGGNVSGGVIGKMISPQSIAVAAAAGGLVGRESDLFRFTVRHSLILLFIVCCLVLAQAYLLTWMIPYHI